MKDMGVWALELYGVKHNLSTNRAESFNSLLKRRFSRHRGYGEDEIIAGSSEIVRRTLARVRRAKHAVGESWLLREHLKQFYPLGADEEEIFDLDIDLLQKGKDLREVS
jgi:hypothetical protein